MPKEKPMFVVHSHYSYLCWRMAMRAMPGRWRTYGPFAVAFILCILLSLFVQEWMGQFATLAFITLAIGKFVIWRKDRTTWESFCEASNESATWKGFVRVIAFYGDRFRVDLSGSSGGYDVRYEDLISVFETPGCFLLETEERYVFVSHTGYQRGDVDAFRDFIDQRVAMDRQIVSGRGRGDWQRYLHRRGRLDM